MLQFLSQAQTICFHSFDSCFLIFIKTVDDVPELFGMIHLYEMSKLVTNDILAYEFRSFDELPVEWNILFAWTCSPFGFLISDIELVIGKIVLERGFCEFLRKIAFCIIFVPLQLYSIVCKIKNAHYRFLFLIYQKLTVSPACCSRKNKCVRFAMKQELIWCKLNLIFSCLLKLRLFFENPTFFAFDDLLYGLVGKTLRRRNMYRSVCIDLYSSIFDCFFCDDNRIYWHISISTSINTVCRYYFFSAYFTDQMS